MSWLRSWCGEGYRETTDLPHGCWSVLEVDTSFASRRLTRELDKVGGRSRSAGDSAIRCDNGPEFTSRHFLAWCVEKKIELERIEPRKPVQNAFVDSFEGRLQDVTSRQRASRNQMSYTQGSFC